MVSLVNVLWVCGALGGSLSQQKLVINLHERNCSTLSHKTSSQESVAEVEIEESDAVSEARGKSQSFSTVTRKQELLKT